MYPDLYNGSVEEDTGPRRTSATSGFDKKWSGYHTIAVLADNDITKFDQVTKLNIHECLTFLTYKKDIAAVEKEQLQQYQNTSIK